MKKASSQQKEVVLKCHLCVTCGVFCHAIFWGLKAEMQKVIQKVHGRKGCIDICGYIHVNDKDPASCNSWTGD